MMNSKKISVSKLNRFFQQQIRFSFNSIRYCFEQRRDQSKQNTAMKRIVAKLYQNTSKCVQSVHSQSLEHKIRARPSGETYHILKPLDKEVLEEIAQRYPDQEFF